jgi:hypothetical protein
MNWKRESLALIFGMLVILIIFGDGIPGRAIGNLDTIFGESLWPFVDVMYPLASIIVFLLYGKSKGGIQVRRSAILPFAALLAGILMIQFDDVFELINHPIKLPQLYWTIARWGYLLVAAGSFLGFGRACERLSVGQKTRDAFKPG